MYTRLTIAAAAVLGMLLGSPVTRAADTWPMPMEWDRTDMVIQLGEYQDDLMVYPGKVTLQEGGLYHFIVVNPSNTTHIVAAPEFSDNALTAALMKNPPSEDLTTAGLVEGITVRPGERLEWYFMPIKEGTYKIGCAQDAHAKAGMHAKIEVL